MIARFTPCRLCGRIEVPPSKSMAHRYLIGAALSGGVSTLSGVDFSQDILATMDCLRAYGAEITVSGDCVRVDGARFLQAEAPSLACRESGSTLRFMIPLALTLGRPVVLTGAPRLLERPLGVYEELCRERGFAFHKDATSLTVCGRLESGDYTVRGDVSSQFITGLILALVRLGQPSTVTVTPPFESRPYVELTVSALAAFGAHVTLRDHVITVEASTLHPWAGKIEGDYSSAAFLDAFNRLGSSVELTGLAPDSLQGDRVYARYFDEIEGGTPTLDVSDCPDLGPVLFALAALKQGATFTGTDRLRAKESDRGAAMHGELTKLGGGLVLGDNSVTVPRQTLRYGGAPLWGHNDHRIVMALSVILCQLGGELLGVEAVAKSYPHFFEDIRKLGAEVEIQ